MLMAAKDAVHHRSRYVTVNGGWEMWRHICQSLFASKLHLKFVCVFFKRLNGLLERGLLPGRFYFRRQYTPGTRGSADSPVDWPAPAPPPLNLPSVLAGVFKALIKWQDSGAAVSQPNRLPTSAGPGAHEMSPLERLILLLRAVWILWGLVRGEGPDSRARFTLSSVEKKKASSMQYQIPNFDPRGLNLITPSAACSPRRAWITLSRCVCVCVAHSSTGKSGW